MKRTTTAARKRCEYCRGYFQANPSRPNQRFCKTEHQKEFWRHGGAATEKLVQRFERELDRRIKEEREWCADWFVTKDVMKKCFSDAGRIIEESLHDLRAELRAAGVNLPD